MLVVNAANVETDMDHIRSRGPPEDVEIGDLTGSSAMVAVQGPKAQKALQPLTDLDLGQLRRFRCSETNVLGQLSIISRTGYTGEDGFEVIILGASNDEPGKATEFWERLAASSKPCGLGARDSLRLLGMGDLETLLEKVREAEIKVPEKKAKAILSGKFTLTDMYEQFEAVKGMGPFRKILKMLPGMSYDVPEEMLNTAEGRLEKWRVIIQSMQPEERDNPKLLNSSRVRRVARGSGTNERDVKDLLKQYVMMRRMLKMFKRKKGKLPFLGKGLPTEFK
jgi:hypothetical protein